MCKLLQEFSAKKVFKNRIELILWELPQIEFFTKKREFGVRKNFLKIIIPTILEFIRKIVI